MSHKANDIVADSKLDILNEKKLEVECTCEDDTTEYAWELAQQEKELEEDRYDASLEPTCNHTH